MLSLPISSLYQLPDKKLSVPFKSKIFKRTHKFY